MLIEIWLKKLLRVVNLIFWRVDIWISIWLIILCVAQRDYFSNWDSFMWLNSCWCSFDSLVLILLLFSSSIIKLILIEGHSFSCYHGRIIKKVRDMWNEYLINILWNLFEVMKLHSTGYESMFNYSIKP